MARSKQEKQERILNTWLPLGIMIGAIIGLGLFYLTNNYLCITGCTIAGIIIGLSVGSSIENKVKTKKKRKK